MLVFLHLDENIKYFPLQTTRPCEKLMLMCFLFLSLKMIILQILLVIYSTDAIFLFFERDSYEFSVSESAPIHTRIGSIRATSSASLAVDYELHGDTNRTFSINRSTGDLILSHSLDYETISIYKLTIEARSSSSIAPCLSELIIHVLNTNDNSPEINLMFYPSVVLRANVLSYDLNSQSTPLGAIYIKDLDQSTSNLTLIINDTEHFQIQFVRQVKNGLVTESTYILSTRNNAQLIHQEDYYLSLNACDNDQPILWTNRSYEFHLQSTEQFCNLSVNGNNSIIDIQETVPNRTLILHARTNKYCPTRFFSIDDTENFYIDAQTGDLYTSARFNRQEQSVYSLTLHLNHQFKQELSIRILDEHQQKPFLTRKRFRIAREDFSSVDLLNSSVCRPQAKIYHSFQLLSNCTLIKLTTPAQGKYLFYIQLNGSNDYEDTVLLDLSSYPTERFFSAFLQSPWTLVVLISLGSFVIIMLFVCTAITIRKQKYNHLSHHKKV